MKLQRLETSTVEKMPTNTGNTTCIQKIQDATQTVKDISFCVAALIYWPIAETYCWFADFTGFEPIATENIYNPFLGNEE